MGLTYKDSGVDIEKGNNFVKRIIPSVKSTFTERVLTGIGGFGALYSGAFPEMKEPVLVSGTDGVGTKITIARMMNIHNTIGIDAVAMCVNDILTSGAAPLFFLDYISCGKLDEDILVEVVKGIAEGCNMAGCSLIGGETAEHPNVMEQTDYDIAGFAVGVVDRDNIITGKNIQDGDIIIGLPSSGIHSNGYSLVRKLFFDMKKYTVEKKISDLPGTLGETLLTPTRIYCRAVTRALSEGIKIKGMVHITGGGFYENIPRILPENTSVIIEKASLDILPVFQVIQKEGNVAEREMFTTFNMGTGMMLFSDTDNSTRLIDTLTKAGEHPCIIGEVVHTDAVQGERVVIK
ncbi:MAG TPA: phosphoribosylformylglycinamidine cyclo-ligase [Spirochaetota bacterium]|nr:phosphoribosylformylglycinamidine cyclo-ligase [Spirochaetota bacterium]HPJ38086.1 phosphoribosylformylglycinamidine cyclo-ligase [Spirochaetota bacterium]HPQ54973.1 phosphoribosylformylglycinamidine cyclo-ligase [Spirochaetota bacterium]